MLKKEVIIIGGGPAGLAAAVRLKELGIEDLLVIEREASLGGILRQCIHDGFGLRRFRETLSGPEYAWRFIEQMQNHQVPYVTNTTVISVSPDKIVTTASREGIIRYQAKVVILAMGCRERTRHALSIPGTRPAGIYTAGVAQAYINLQNIMPGKEVIILGSGDIGMIMARRMTLEGAHVKGVFEVQPYPSGLPRNIEQCLNDYEIPLYLSHTVIDIHGERRLEGVTIAEVDEAFCPIPGTECFHACDTLILSVGLIPENELSLAAGVCLDDRTKAALVDEYYQTSVDGIFAAGNVLQVHDLVDYVSLEGERLAESVAEYLAGNIRSGMTYLQVKTDIGISHTIPQQITGKKDFVLSMRVKKPFSKCSIELYAGDTCIKRIPYKKLLPAEMIQISVKSEWLNEATELEVRVV